MFNHINRKQMFKVGDKVVYDLNFQFYDRDEHEDNTYTINEVIFNGNRWYIALQEKPLSRYWQERFKHHIPKYELPEELFIL